MRRRHRGAGQGGVGVRHLRAVVERREDVIGVVRLVAGAQSARGIEVDPEAGVRVGGHLTRAIHGADTQHLELCGRLLAQRQRVVPRGEYHHDALGRGAVDRRRELRVAQSEHRQRVAEREVDDVGPVVGGPIDALIDRRSVAAPGGVEHPDRQNLGLGCHALDPEAVVGIGGDDPRHVGAVTVGVRRAPPRADEVIPGQELPLKVGVIEAHAGVDHGDNGPAAGDARMGRVGLDHVQTPLILAQRRLGERRRGRGQHQRCDDSGDQSAHPKASLGSRYARLAGSRCPPPRCT